MLKPSKIITIVLVIFGLHVAWQSLSPTFVIGQVSPDTASTNNKIISTKNIPIAVEKIRIGVDPTAIIGEVRAGLWGIVTEQFSASDLGDGSNFIATVYKVLKDAGYKPAADTVTDSDKGDVSVFGDMNQDTQRKSSSARFLVGGTITKVWMTVASDAWAGWSTDIDMNVKWEVYDTDQKKVIYTKESYAVDAGGGRTNAYYQTVMAKSAEKLFSSPEFELALQKAITNPLPTTLPSSSNITTPLVRPSSPLPK